MTRKIILDCDPGHDDAVALIMAGKSPEIDLLGVTVVAGNQTLEKTVKNALNVSQHLGIDVPIFAGCDRPLVAAPRNAGFVHGPSGLEGPEFAPLTKKLERRHAVSYIISTLMASDGHITLVPTGPLTNIALALRLEPRIADKIERIVLMGGSFSNGNITPAAEFNIFADPEAARIVFECGRPIVMCGLDVTRKVACTQEIIDRIASHYNLASELFAEMMFFYGEAEKKVFGVAGGILHDPVTIAYLIDESILTLKECHVEVDTNDGPSYGRTNCDLYGMSGKPANACVAVDINTDRFWDILDEVIALY